VGREHVIGWVAVGLGTLVATLWAFWGAIEAFHEGWCSPTLWLRILGVFAYLVPMAVPMVLTLLGIRWPKVGGTLLFLVGAWFSWWVFRRPGMSFVAILSWLPVTALAVAVGLIFWFGRVRNPGLAYTIAAGVPLLVAVACGAGGAWRVAHRVDDGFRGERLVEGNGVALVWAPEGPGWVRSAHEACDWNEAGLRCAHLSRDGTRLEEEPRYVWRLPTVEEYVASCTRHGANSGGVWDPATQRARYRMKPDKESPLWDQFAETIYWWTSTEPSADEAYRAVYDGGVFSSRKTLRMGSLGFRAVREPDDPRREIEVAVRPH
jgi:hypothetical protein